MYFYQMVKIITISDVLFQGLVYLCQIYKYSHDPRLKISQNYRKFNNDRPDNWLVILNDASRAV